MLKRPGGLSDVPQVKLNISEAGFPAPFYQGLEYSSPARGTWNIAHTGFLIPGAHEIFVCPYGCLRGVVLTAAEMNALDRYSSISISEENVLDGGMESLMIDGVSEIVERLEPKPPVVLIYISCQHFFLAYDQDYVFETLRNKYPDISFVDCYMIPTLRKSGVTPDQKMKVQMHASWKKTDTVNEKAVNLIGSDLPLYEKAELREWLGNEGIEIKEISTCTTFEEYMKMSESGLNIYYEPSVKMAADDLEERLGMKNLYLTFSYDKAELMNDYGMLAEALGLKVPDFSEDIKLMEEEIRKAKDIIGDTEIVIDYTFTFRPLSMAALLLEEGFNVTEVYTDSFVADDKVVFDRLRISHPDLKICPTNQPEMRFVHDDSLNEEVRSSEGVKSVTEKSVSVLALGQKAAYFRGTDHFVNVAESGGYFGFRGIAEIFRLMIEAYCEKKDRRSLIQMKGIGCESCI